MDGLQVPSLRHYFITFAFYFLSFNLLLQLVPLALTSLHRITTLLLLLTSHIHVSLCRLHQYTCMINPILIRLTTLHNSFIGTRSSVLMRLVVWLQQPASYRFQAFASLG